MLGWNSEAYAERARAFGWHAIEIDGHDVTAIDKAYTEAIEQLEQPTLIIAKTMKGRGVSFLENKDGWHGKALNEEQARQAIEELGGERHITIQVQKPDAGTSSKFQVPGSKLSSSSLEPGTWNLELPTYKVGDQVATRRAYGDALSAL